jgi:hypothetical protein
MTARPQIPRVGGDMLAAARAMGTIAAASMLGRREALAAAVELESAHIRLAVVTPPDCRPMVTEEVERRAVALGSPLRAVLSVTEDVITGRWRLP